jgi:hypothetical protein
MDYDNAAAAAYALKYALAPNPAYVYFDGNDCTNFVSQALRAGGCENDYNDSHPWWYANREASVCWAVAHSLYWYIRTNTAENRFGIKADTYAIADNDQYPQKIAGRIVVGDIIQYRNFQDRIQHSAVITAFDAAGEPLVSQHTYDAKNVSWRRNFKEVIFHHITRIN